MTAVRFWTFGESTRVAIEVTSEFEFHADRATSPSRLFFDIDESASKIGRRGQQTIPVGDKLIKQIRVAEPKRGTTRIVFDLAAEADYTASQLSNPDRLMIELRPAGQIPPKPAEEKAELPPPPVVMAPVAAAPPITLPVKIDAPKPTEAVRSRKTDAAVREAERAAKITTLPSPTPKAAKMPRDSEGSLTRVLGLKVGRIVIDAGHGGGDTGTEGPTGLLEKDLVLDVSRRLGAMIENRLGSEVIYTRSDDTFIPLEDRTRLANEKKADLFLSIHANSSPVRSSSGVETYYLNFTSNKEALDVAARENASSQKTVHELRDLVQQITLRDKLDESREFARRVQSSLFVLSSKSNSKAKDRGVKKAPFVVLIGAQMPSILAEIGFVSNPRDEGLMKRGDFRQKLAEALFRGVSSYAGTLSSFQIAQK